jgi:hypothetical protein
MFGTRSGKSMSTKMEDFELAEAILAGSSRFGDLAKRHGYAHDPAIHGASRSTTSTGP